MERTVGLNRGERQNWINQNIIKPIGTKGGVRIFDFGTLLAAEIAKTLARQSGRTSLSVIVAVLDRLRNENIDFAYAITRPKSAHKIIDVEIPDVDTDAAGQSAEITVESLGSPVEILVRVNVTLVAQALAKKIISQAGLSK